MGLDGTGIYAILSKSIMNRVGRDSQSDPLRGANVIKFALTREDTVTVVKECA